jgi:GTPase SAR1 family protein
VFDVSRTDSFDNVSSWVEQIETNAGTMIHKILVGNKTDVETRAITTEQGQDLAEAYGMAYYETSAKTGDGVTPMFMGLTESIVNSNVLEALAESYRLKYGLGKKRRRLGCCKK